MYSSRVPPTIMELTGAWPGHLGTVHGASSTVIDIQTACYSTIIDIQAAYYSTFIDSQTACYSLNWYGHTDCMLLNLTGTDIQTAFYST